MEKINLINGNGQEYKLNLPKIVYLTDFINDVALQHIKENTGLVFKKTFYGYEVQPTKSHQIVALLMTYNFKTNFENNLSNKNTLFLKSDYHVGFKVNSICFNCCKENRIPTHGLKENERLSC